MKLDTFLKIKGKKILLQINEYEFILDRKSAENMVVALRGALKRLTKRAADASQACTNFKKARDGKCYNCGFDEESHR